MGRVELMGASAAAVSSNGIQPRIVGPLALNPTHRLAADLIAEGGLSVDRVAERVGVTRWTLWAWRQRPEFCRLVAERREYYQTEALSHGVALRHRRVAAYNRIWDRLHRVIEQRAAGADPNVPGADTGLLVSRQRGLGQGDNFRVVTEHEVDVGLLRELRALGELAAKELGQWQEPHSATGPPEVEAASLTTAELLERARLILEAHGLTVVETSLPAEELPRGSDVDGDGAVASHPPPAASP
jgi:hypothetical protein